MPQTMPKQIDELIQSIRESYDLGPTLLDAIKILEKVRDCPEQIKHCDTKYIAEYFSKE